MERKENLFQPPEYTAEMFAEYFESEKARALRASEIEAILGDDYDLDRLRNLVEADRDGRCVVHPKDYDGTLFRIWKNKIVSSERFAWIMKELGKTMFPSREAAEAALKGERNV